MSIADLTYSPYIKFCLTQVLLPSGNGIDKLSSYDTMFYSNCNLKSTQIKYNEVPLAVHLGTINSVQQFYLKNCKDVKNEEIICESFTFNVFTSGLSLNMQSHSRKKGILV